MSDSLSILYVSHLHPPAGRPLESLGGIQTVSMNLMGTFEQHPGLEVIPWVNRTPWRGIEWSTARFLWKSFQGLPRMISHSQPDVVLFTSMVTASLSPWLKYRGVRTPLISISHGHDVTLDIRPYQRYLPRVFANLDGVISVSRATQQETLKRGLNPEKSFVVHNGIDPGYESHLPDYDQAMQKLPVAPNKPMLLTVGRLVKRKGHAWFLSEVLPSVKTPLQYVIIGEGPEEEEIHKLSDKINAEGHHRVIMMGRQDQDVLHAAYRVADLFVMPNIPVQGDMEGFGVVLLEANLSSTPAIVSDLEGMKDVIEPGINGFRIEAGNHQAFAGKIDEFIEPGKKASLSVLAEQSAQYVREHFFWNKIVEHYVDVIQITRKRTQSDSI